MIQTQALSAIVRQFTGLLCAQRCVLSSPWVHSGPCSNRASGEPQAPGGSSLKCGAGCLAWGSTGLAQPDDHFQDTPKELVQLSGQSLSLQSACPRPSPSGDPSADHLYTQGPATEGPRGGPSPRTRPAGPSLVFPSRELTWRGAFRLGKASFCSAPLFGGVLAV